MTSPAFVRHQVNELEWTLMDGQGKGFRETIIADAEREETKGADAFLKERIKDLDKVASDVSSGITIEINASSGVIVK